MGLEVKDTENDWAMSIAIREDRDVIARQMLGEPFLLRAHDDALGYKFYRNGK